MARHVFYHDLYPVPMAWPEHLKHNFETLPSLSEQVTESKVLETYGAY